MKTTLDIGQSIGNYRKIALTVIWVVMSIPVCAQSSKDVTMTVGETQTLYLPSSVTSKNLKSVTFYSNGISYVQVSSYTSYSVTIKAIKAFSSPVIVRCDYHYYVRNGSYIYEATGFYDYRVTVVGGTVKVEPASIKFSSSVVAVKVGEARQLTPVVLPENAEYTLVWSINNSSVASISQSGMLVGLSEGAADLKVKADNGVYAMLRVVVSKVEPSSVSVTPSSLSVAEGSSKYLSARVYPSNASQKVSWSSSNTSVVTVDGIGKVTGIKAGTAVITASTSNGKKGTCTVTCVESIPDLVLSDADGADNLPAKANVVYERKLFSGWNSACLPFSLTQAMLDNCCDDCRIATIGEMEIIGSQRRLSLVEVLSVGAGEPCLIYAPKECLCKISLTGVSLRSKPDNSSKLQGTYYRETIGPGCYKLSGDGMSFGLTKSDDAIAAPFRAYVRLDVPTPAAVSESVKIKFIQL